MRWTSLWARRWATPSGLRTAPATGPYSSEGRTLLRVVVVVVVVVVGGGVVVVVVVDDVCVCRSSQKLVERVRLISRLKQIFMWAFFFSLGEREREE